MHIVSPFLMTWSIKRIEEIVKLCDMISSVTERCISLFCLSFPLILRPFTFEIWRSHGGIFSFFLLIIMLPVCWSYASRATGVLVLLYMCLPIVLHDNGQQVMATIHCCLFGVNEASWPEIRALVLQISCLLLVYLFLSKQIVPAF